MPIPLLIAGAVIIAGVAAHSRASDVNEKARNIAREKETSLYDVISHADDYPEFKTAIKKLLGL